MGVRVALLCTAEGGRNGEGRVWAGRYLGAPARGAPAPISALAFACVNDDVTCLSRVMGYDDVWLWLGQPSEGEEPGDLTAGELNGTPSPAYWAPGLVGGR